MALTLTSATGPTDRVIAITGTVPDDIEAGYEFRLDDERLVLTTFALHEVQYPGWTQKDPNRNSWIVKRGVAASHDAGTTIQGAVDAFVSAETETPPTPFAASGGGQQLVSLLGPYEMTFGQADGAWVSLVTLPAGTIVMIAFARATSDFDEPVNLSLAIGSTLDPEDNHTLTAIDGIQFFNQFWGADVGFSKNSVSQAQRVAFAITDADLVAAIDPVGTPPATGTIAIYAFVATPV